MKKKAAEIVLRIASNHKPNFSKHSSMAIFGQILTVLMTQTNQRFAKI